MGDGQYTQFRAVTPDLGYAVGHHLECIDVPCPSERDLRDNDLDELVDEATEIGLDAPAGTLFDNCPNVANPEQADFNEDGVGDVCGDHDLDGITDAEDNCREIANPGQLDNGKTPSEVPKYQFKPASPQVYITRKAASKRKRSPSLPPRGGGADSTPLITRNQGVSVFRHHRL